MKSATVLAMLKAAVGGDRDQVLLFARQIEADERNAKRVTVANQFERTIRAAENGSARKTTTFSGSQWMQLPKKSEGVLAEVATNPEPHDIQLQRSVIAELEQILAEHEHAESLSEHLITPSNRLLIHGPSGTGKTSIAKKIARDLGRPLLIPGRQIVASYLGESQRNFDAMLNEAKNQQCILLLDEFDSIGGTRDQRGKRTGAEESSRQLTNAILIGLESVPSHVVVICCTNLISVLDEALFRRFDAIIELPHPSPHVLREFAHTLAAAYQCPTLAVDGLELGTNFATTKRAVLKAIKQQILAKLAS